MSIHYVRVGNNSSGSISLPPHLFLVSPSEGYARYVSNHLLLFPQYLADHFIAPKCSIVDELLAREYRYTRIMWVAIVRTVNSVSLPPPPLSLFPQNLILKLRPENLYAKCSLSKFTYLPHSLVCSFFNCIVSTVNKIS